MRKCLVTGGAGFIGSHLVDRLISQGDSVVVWDNYSTGSQDSHNEKAQYNWIDLSFPLSEQLDEEGRENRFDVVFHLAAESRIQPSLKDPLNTHNSNATGTARVLEFARSQKAKFVFSSTSCLDFDNYANPYALTKKIGEDYCTMYNRLYGMSISIARFFNVYGPRQVEEGSRSTVVGIFERQSRRNESLTITGTGEKRRDFIHVDDIVSGLRAMSEGDWNSEIFNLGTGENHSINELAKMFNSPVRYIPEREGEADQTLADIFKAKNLLNWEPKKKIEDYVLNLFSN